eukprot:Nk52_evm24s359 gene=Nk52_evmTU24s359
MDGEHHEHATSISQSPPDPRAMGFFSGSPDLNRAVSAPAAKRQSSRGHYGSGRQSSRPPTRASGKGRSNPSTLPPSLLRYLTPSRTRMTRKSEMLTEIDSGDRPKRQIRTAQGLPRITNEKMVRERGQQREREEKKNASSRTSFFSAKHSGGPPPRAMQFENQRKKLEHLWKRPQSLTGSGNDISFLYDAVSKPNIKEREENVEHTLIPEEYHIVVSPGSKALEFVDEKYGMLLVDKDQKVSAFPSIRPGGRKEVQWLANTLHQMLEKAKFFEDPNEGPTNMHNLLELIQKEQNLYNIAFHELIRQVTFHCKERGQLLSDIREHYKSLLAKVPKQIVEIHEELMANKALNRKLVNELLRFRKNVLDLKNELHKVRRHDELITEQANFTESQLSQALSESNKNAGLLTEYHELYELQRARIENQILKVSEERDAWAETTAVLAAMVAKESNLGGIARLQEKEKSWSKFANHIAVTIADYNSTQLSDLYRVISNWTDMWVEVSSSLMLETNQSCDKLYNFSKSAESYEKVLEAMHSRLQAGFDEGEFVIYMDSLEKFKEQIKQWMKASTSITELFEGEHLLERQEAIGSISLCIDNWVSTATKLFTRYKDEHVQRELLTVTSFIDKVTKMFQKRITGEDNIAKTMVSIRNQLEMWKGKLVVIINQNDITETELIKLKESVKEWRGGAFEIKKMLEENRKSLSEGMNQSFDMVNVWVKKVSGTIEKEDDMRIDTALNLHLDLVDWSAHFLIKLCGGEQHSVQELTMNFELLTERLEDFSECVPQASSGLNLDNYDLRQLHSESSEWVKVARELLQTLDSKNDVKEKVPEVPAIPKEPQVPKEPVVAEISVLKDSVSSISADNSKTQIHLSQVAKKVTGSEYSSKEGVGSGIKDVVIQLQAKLKQQECTTSEWTSKYKDLEQELNAKKGEVEVLKDKIVEQKEQLLRSSSLYAELYKSQNIAPTSRRKSKMQFIGSLAGLNENEKSEASQPAAIPKATDTTVPEETSDLKSAAKPPERRQSLRNQRNRANTEGRNNEPKVVIQYKLDPELQRNVETVERRLGNLEMRMHDLDGIMAKEGSVLEREGALEKRSYAVAKKAHFQRYPTYEKGSLLNEGSYARSLFSPDATIEDKEPKSENYIIALIRDIYSMKAKIDIAADVGHVKRERVPDFIHGYLSQKFHMRKMVDQKLHDLFTSLDFYRKELPEVELFASFVEESRPLDQFSFFMYNYIWMERVVYGIKVPVDPSTTVTSYVCLDRALEVSKKAMDALNIEYLPSIIGQVTSKCVPSESLQHMKSYQDTGEHIGEINPNWISVTELSEFLLEFYVDAEARHMEKLSKAFLDNDRDKDGFITFEELTKITLEFDPFWAESQVLSTFRKQISKSHSEYLSYENFMEMALSIGFVHGNNFSLRSILNGVVLGPELRSIHHEIETRWTNFKEYCNLMLLELAKSKKYIDQALIQELWMLRERLEIALSHEDTGAAVAHYKGILHAIFKHQEEVTIENGNLNEEYFSVELKAYEFAIVQQLIINYPKIAKIYSRKPVEEKIELPPTKEKVNLSQEEKMKMDKEIDGIEKPSDVDFTVGKIDKENHDWIEEGEEESELLRLEMEMEKQKKADENENAENASQEVKESTSEAEENMESADRIESESNGGIETANLPEDETKSQGNCTAGAQEVKGDPNEAVQMTNEETKSEEGANENNPEENLPGSEEVVEESASHEESTHSPNGPKEQDLNET